MVLAAIALFHLAALGLLAAGTWGLFGAERDPLAGVYLVPLGSPWNRLADAVPEGALPAVGVLAPAVNLALLWALCAAVRRGR